MSTLFDEVASPEGQGNDQKASRFGDADRKRLIIVGGVGAVAILAAGGYFLLGSGSSDDSTATGPVATHHATPRTAVASPSATPKASASPTSVPTIQSALATGRDPFAPLVVAPAVTSSPSASATPGTTDGSGGTGSSTTGGTTGTTDGPSASASPSTSAAAADGKFTLNKLYFDENNVWFADVTWNGKNYKPTLESTFGGTFTFVAESNGYASFKNGNQAFSLSVGESKQF